MEQLYYGLLPRQPQHDDYVENFILETESASIAVRIQ